MTKVISFSTVLGRRRKLTPPNRYVPEEEMHGMEETEKQRYSLAYRLGFSEGQYIAETKRALIFWSGVLVGLVVGVLVALVGGHP